MDGPLVFVVRPDDYVVLVAIFGYMDCWYLKRRALESFVISADDSGA